MVAATAGTLLVDGDRDGEALAAGELFSSSLVLRLVLAVVVKSSALVRFSVYVRLIQ